MIRRFDKWAASRVARASLTLAAALATLAAGAGGCTTEAFCFRDCGDTTTSSTTTHSGTGGEGGCINCTTTTFVTSSSGSGGSGACVETNNGIEICDGKDNDCNGTIDDVVGLDLEDPHTCGTCDNNCFQIPGSNWLTDEDQVSCTPSADPGNVPGTCHGACAPHYFDIDKDAQGFCEYSCIKLGDDDATCNGIDDDCDGQTDEDVDKCTSNKDCGFCGHACNVANGTGACVKTGGGAACDATNTACQVASCTCNGPGDCYWNVDGDYANGCELKCDQTNGGIEICDGIDNDCNGVVDDNPTDAQLGTTCFGGTTGVCADSANAGTFACVAGHIACAGANVVQPGQFQELCNGLDDNCDGTVDDNPVDTGPTFLCGASATLPCQKGSLQCLGGMKVCVGNLDPAPETCDGVDNNCDGTIDNNLPAAQNGAPCNVPVPPPVGVTSPCKGGTTACTSGAVVCVGSVLPAPGAVDGCNIDANCDGALTNQPDLMTDVHHCGMCGNDCTTGSVHANWACVGGSCAFQGCQQGYYDNGASPDAIAGDNKCGYACQFTSAQELCNGIDDNCNGSIDENVIPPSPPSVCGVFPAASAPECLPYNLATNPGGVDVACVNGGWQCTFHTAGVCNPTCAAASEVCETVGAALDNNCNGLVNENVPNWNQPCASDAGQPPPGDGVCRTIGSFVCSAANAVTCNAVKDNTKAGPELCDGIDNDCDGTIDETFNDPGTNTAFFVKPIVTKIQATPAVWIYSFEASRPDASVLTAGSGNGFYTSAPVGTTLDKTPACSAPAKVPWFNVTGDQVDQTCAAMGGHTCTPAEWQTACHAKSAPAPSCSWGYGAAGAGCTSSFVAGTKYCNLGPSFDYDGNAANGVQNNLLPTAWDMGTTWLQAAPLPLANCWADWSAVLGNTTANDRVYDITGNLREITKAATNQYTLLGGAFDSNAESGSTCDFTFYNVDSDFEFFDTGFRCCFSQDPTVYTCGNAAKDGTETDIDCGGGMCPKCVTTKNCLVNADCVSNVCISATKKCQ